jgi:uncharacterized membrane protein
LLKMQPSDLFAMTSQGAPVTIDTITMALIAAVDQTIASLLTGLFAGVSGNVGTSGVDLDPDVFFDAIYVLNLANNPRGLAAVLHPQQVNDLIEGMRGETGAIQFSVPLLIALLSAWWLGERLDSRRWLAIAAGLGGVMLIMRPWTGAFHPALLLSVGNAFLYAGFNILTRRLAATESPASLQLMSAIGAAVVIAPFGLAQWKDPADALTWAVIGLAGLCGGLGHYFVAQAHRYATAATLGPFLYQQILYMTLLGWLVFAQVPDALVIAGAAVVVASGLYLLWVEVRGGGQVRS